MANTPVTINYWCAQLEGVPPPLISPPRSSVSKCQSLPEVRALNQREFFDRDFYRDPGIHVIFMPKIVEGLGLEGNEDLCERLAKKFHLPEFFFRRLGWNANGMFGSIENLPQVATERSYGTFSRFLSKQVKETNSPVTTTLRETHNTKIPPILAPEYEYVWHYMGFCTLWRSSGHDSQTKHGQEIVQPSGGETHLLLCFDLDGELAVRLRRILNNADLTNWKGEPFLLLEFALTLVMDQFEDDLWSFQQPVRRIEKTRQKAQSKATDPEKNGYDENEENEKEIFDFLNDRYNQLHELSRHVIHISETVDAASSTLGAIVRDHDMWMRSTNDASAAAKRLAKALLLRENIITSLRFRANAFVHRMNNEIKCASNFVAVADNRISKGILKQTRNDGKVLSDTVSALTLLFLPGTFISGFFGMNFFVLQGDSSTQPLQWRVHPKIWVFFLCTIPITVLGFFVFMLEFNFLTWIKSMQMVMQRIASFCRRPSTDSGENLYVKDLATSRPQEVSYNNFGFSRRGTYHTTA